MPQAHTVTGSQQRTPSVVDLINNNHDALTAGRVVELLLKDHSAYVDDGIEWDEAVTAGPTRAVAEHVEAAARRWDSDVVPVLTGRHVVLGLAIEPGVGWPLLRSRVIASILARWQPGLGTDEEPYRLIWDLLTDEARAECEDVPLLATAFGAPAEWSGKVTAEHVCWSPSGDRIAVLNGGEIFELAPDRPPHRVTDGSDGVVAIGWGRGGIVALRLAQGVAELTRVATRTPIGDAVEADAAVLSGDGSCAWVERDDGIYKWTPQHQPRLTKMAEPATVRAVSWDGSDALLEHNGRLILARDLPNDDLSTVVGEPIGPRALVRLGTGRTGVAAADTDNGGVRVDNVTPTGIDQVFSQLVRIVTGPGAITALATDGTGSRLAVGIANRVEVWTLSQRRPTGRRVPRYDSDRAAGSDLLDADRDARALAALISSRDLRPPLAIGLFGAWGSGKSFMLNRIEEMIAECTSEGHAVGYLDHVSIIRFNAWHYAETNLWASLVDAMLRGITPAPPPPDSSEEPPNIVSADRRVTQAEERLSAASDELAKARNAVDQAKRVLARRRRRFWLLGSAAVLLAATAIAAVLVGGVGTLIGGASVALALIASVGAAMQAGTQAYDAIQAARSGPAASGRAAGRPEELPIRVAAERLQTLIEEHAAAESEAQQSRSAAAQLRYMASAEPLVWMLHQLSAVKEYRDQLSLARIRDLFADIDYAVAQARARGDRGPGLERAVIVIDDLDRCPPEHVVKVLEAVHLLFDFEMFVVILAVDTRWLDQSLRIRYRDLLGQPDTAAPSDFLEKIIQVPLQLPPMDDGLVRKLIAGLTGTAPEAMLSPSPIPLDTERPASRPTDGALTATYGRSVRRPLPPELLKVTPAEATALSAVAPLVGTTPRTVKRFVNTYQLIKARAADPVEFDNSDGPIGDHEVVAFLLAVLTGRPSTAGALGQALATAQADVTVESIVAPLDAEVRDWLAGNPRYARAPARRYAQWSAEVARFSYFGGSVPA